MNPWPVTEIPSFFSFCKNTFILNVFIYNNIVSSLDFNCRAPLCCVELLVLSLLTLLCSVIFVCMGECVVLSTKSLCF